MKRDQKGFGVIEGLLVVIALTLIVGVGFYVANANKKETNNTIETSQSAQSDTKKEKAPKLTEYELKQEKLKLGYNEEYWKVAHAQSGSIDCQPDVQVKRDALALNHNDFDLSFHFGQCPGKGGGICFDEPDSGCVRETQNLGKVKVTPNKTWYILVGRTTIDSGSTWEYDLWLHDKPSCESGICPIPATNISDDISSITGSYKDQSSISSLNEFAQLPEVKAAVDVLKTVKY